MSSGSREEVKKKIEPLEYQAMNRLFLFSILFFRGILGLTAESDQTSFMVGYSKRNITPTEPVPLWGYGDRHDELSTGIHDPLYADALVLQMNGTKLAIVGLDLGRSPSESSLMKIRRRIQKKAGIAHSFIAASHTHHGPVLELSNHPGMGQGKFDATLRYYHFLENQIVSAVINADQDLEPARMGAGKKILNKTPFQRNRHTKKSPPSVDRDLAVLRIDRSDGRLKTLLINFAAHPTSITSKDRRFSADYVGVLKREVSETMNCSVVFMQGASGDLSAQRGNNDFEQFGMRLAEEVIPLAHRIQTSNIKSDLQINEERFMFSSRVDWSNPLVAMAYGVAFFPELIPNYLKEYRDGIRPRLTVALLPGEIALVGASGEFFCEHAIRLKKRAALKHLFFFGYCNGYHQYFPTIEAVAEGGYGADQTVSPVEIGAGEKMMNKALIKLFQMRGIIGD